ncbi:hypothetical protein ABE504_17870 [Paenibacillus oryzisoli]|uniref:lipase family protein n=1 Tax=Paenibacillus oryzisoli TaxID=1850517 RepID=UPI003D26AE77
MTHQTEKPAMAVYVTAGFATAPNFLDEFADKLVARLVQEGISARAVIHFPYGDWHRSKRNQLFEIASDMWLHTHRRPTKFGGIDMARLIRQDAAADERLLLIGHSAGAVAALISAQLLRGEGRTIAGVIQIGSPRCAVPAALQDVVLNIEGVHPETRRRDVIPRFGTWGGLSWRKWFTLGWHRTKHAPVHRISLPLIGGHPDYFRSGAPYRWQEITNLQAVIDVIWRWLQTREEATIHAGYYESNDGT